MLAIALYRKTQLDPFWKLEKRLYAHAPQIVQSVIRAFYVAAFRLGKLASGANFREYVANYRSFRGMDFYHNVHDWLAGYPYETTLAPEVDANLAGRHHARNPNCRRTVGGHSPSASVPELSHLPERWFKAVLCARS
jgi:hypothetical protein